VLVWITETQAEFDCNRSSLSAAAQTNPIVRTRGCDHSVARRSREMQENERLVEAHVAMYNIYGQDRTFRPALEYIRGVSQNTGSDQLALLISVVVQHDVSHQLPGRPTAGE